jgi:hypothetical protein
MLRPVGASIAFLLLVLGARAGEQPESNVKEFGADLEQLNGNWISPKLEFAPGITGRLELKLEFKKDSTAGQATVLNFVSKSGVFVKVGPTWIAELKEKDKKRFIVLAEKKGDTRFELGEISYEVLGDKLKLTSEKTFLVEKGGNPFTMSGEWQRRKADKK